MSSNEPNAAPEKTILIIDDDREIASMLHGVLQSNGYRVFLAPNGAEGQRQISSLKPDLVITDMMMPYASGFEILAKVKGITGSRVPVIILSSMGQDNMIEEAFSLGADDYITKPFSLNELSVRVNKLAVQHDHF